MEVEVPEYLIDSKNTANTDKPFVVTVANILRYISDRKVLIPICRMSSVKVIDISR